MTTTRAYIYLNDGDDNFFGYDPEKHAGKLRLVARTPPIPASRDGLSILDDVFTELNIGGTYLNLADDYREAGNRSLSVGDVVVLERDGVFTTWACESSGWTRYTGQPIRVVNIKSST